MKARLENREKEETEKNREKEEIRRKRERRDKKKERKKNYNFKNDAVLTQSEPTKFTKIINPDNAITPSITKIQKRERIK